MTEELMKAIQRYDMLRRRKIAILEILKDDEQKLTVSTEITFRKFLLRDTGIAVPFYRIKPLVIEHLNELSVEIDKEQRKLEAAMAAFKEA